MENRNVYGTYLYVDTFDIQSCIDLSKRLDGNHSFINGTL